MHVRVVFSSSWAGLCAHYGECETALQHCILTFTLSSAQTRRFASRAAAQGVLLLGEAWTVAAVAVAVAMPVAVAVSVELLAYDSPSIQTPCSSYSAPQVAACEQPLLRVIRRCLCGATNIVQLVWGHHTVRGGEGNGTVDEDN